MCQSPGSGARSFINGRAYLALDPISTAKIEDLVEELKNNYTIIMVTHNMQQATRVSDKTAFLLNGEIIEYGKPVKSSLFQKISEQKII